jgi:hypothetical protein
MWIVLKPRPHQLVIVDTLIAMVAWVLEELGQAPLRLLRQIQAQLTQCPFTQPHNHIITQLGGPFAVEMSCGKLVNARFYFQR